LPNTVLDIVVGGPLVDTEVTSPKNTAEKPANVPMHAKKEKEMTDKDAAATSACSYRQAYDPQATAMESHIDRLDVASSTRVSQVWPYVPPPADKGFQVTYQSGGAASAHSLGPQEYPATSSPENSSWRQEYSTPGRDVTKATISASQGDKVAQVSLGDMYKDGHGVYQDYQTAMDWYLKAASQSHPDGEYKVGVMHSLGLGVPQDYFQAMNWFLNAAIQGHASAQYNVGLYYDVGRGVTRDYLKAEEWYQKAADQGNADAIKMLSVSDNNKKDLTVD
jgi:TPR repeat protein